MTPREIPFSVEDLRRIGLLVALGRTTEAVFALAALVNARDGGAPATGREHGPGRLVPDLAWLANGEQLRDYLDRRLPRMSSRAKRED